MSRTPIRSVPRSLVCSTLAVVLAAVPSLPLLAAAPVLAAAPSKSGKAKKAKTTTVEDAEAPPKEEAAPAPEVPASPDGDPEALSAAAVERFEAKDYDGAVALFEQAYAADPNPNYLFNIGRVYEEKGDLENAVVYYQRFVGEPGVDIESRQTATDRLKVLREALAQLKADEEPKDDEPKDEGTDEPVVEQPPITDEDDERAAKRKKALRISGYSLMGAGGVGLILGGVFGGLASGSVEDADTMNDGFVDRYEGFKRRARQQALVADAMFITGGVLLATGVVLVLSTLGRKKAGGDVSRKAMWSPVVGPQEVGVGITRRF